MLIDYANLIEVWLWKGFQPKVFWHWETFMYMD